MVRRPSPLAALSPRRRALALGAGGLAAAAVTAGALFAWGGGGDGGGLPPQDQPGPVLLVPGYGGGTGALEALAGRIRATGRSAAVVRRPGGGTGDLAEQADALDAEADRALRNGAPSVDVVGYSAGGVVARLWATDHDGARKARRVVTLGSPHRGARIAALGSALDACPPACQQLAPGSSLLSRLGRTGLPAGPAWLSVWTAQDEVVMPPESSSLDGAVNVAVQSVCPGEEVAHSELPTDPLVTGLVLRAIGTAPLAAPVPADCQALRSLGRGRFSS